MYEIMITVVTSLYDIDRENLDGRSWDSYLEWFKKTLEINNPMVVFVDNSTREFVEINRGEKETLIISEPIEKAPYYNLKNSIDLIIQSEEYRKKIKDSDRIECKSSLYNIIQYSKFGWVERAADINPFNSNLYLWLDAGISRFFDSLEITTANKYPSDTFIESISDMDNEVFIQIFMSSYPDLVNSASLSEEYLTDNRSYIAGGIFIASRNSIKRIKKEIDNILLNLMLGKGFINNEQIAMGYLLKKKPELFRIFQNYSHIHRNYEILNQLKT
jgi:hypothetical protein